ERVLAQGQPSEPLLAMLERRLLEEGEHPLILWGMRGERAAIDQTLESLQTGHKRLSYMGIREDEEAVLLLSGPLKSQRAEILRVNTALVEAAKLPLDQQAVESARVLSQLPSNATSPQRMFQAAAQLAWWRPGLVSNQA